MRKYIRHQFYGISPASLRAIIGAYVANLRGGSGGGAAMRPKIGQAKEQRFALTGSSRRKSLRRTGRSEKVCLD